MPPILRNGSFLFVLQSQPFYQARSVTLTSAISNIDDPVPIGSSDWHRFFFSCLVWRLALERKKVIREIGGDEGKRGRHQENLKKKRRKEREKKAGERRRKERGKKGKIKGRKERKGKIE